MDEFHTKKRARKKRAKWWGDHIVLAYALITGIFAFVYVGIYTVDRHLPAWLASLGVTPSGNLLDSGDSVVRGRRLGNWHVEAEWSRLAGSVCVVPSEWHRDAGAGVRDSLI